MEFVDYYKIMGLEASASQDEIKKAYRKLARQFHPDVNKEADSEERFKRVGEAYRVLKDPEKRQEYDAIRQYQTSSGGGFQPPPGWQSTHEQSGGYHYQQSSGDYSDFFEQIFGSRFRDSAASHTEQHVDSRGQDIHSRLPISIQDAFAGASVEVALQIPTMHSDGSIRHEQKKLVVKVPAGVRQGQKIRLKGQGGPGVGNLPSGDLYIELLIKDDPVFHLDGRDVTVSLPLTPWQAALGASVTVPTLSGAVKMTVPANAKAGQRLRLKGRGLPGKPAGDQYVLLKLVIPEVVTDAQKDAYRKLSALWPTDPKTDNGGSS